MPPDDALIDRLVSAILDGAPVDWQAAESSSAATRRLVEQLKVLAAVAEVHLGAPAVNVEERWGHLRLVERIGRGSFGEVYRAWDSRLDREVALKLLPAGGSSDDGRASEVMHEGRLLARVRHPNVVTIYGAEQISDRVGLWMELVRGRTLEEILQEENALGVNDAVAIGLELCAAVAAVHRAGLLHRDIKTDNVMRADDGRIVLMDFGTGREVGDGAGSDLAGTPLYLAPEVLDGRPATVQSDIYSLGVLIYRLVSGAYPVHAETVREVRGAHARRERVPIRAVRPGVPVRLARILDRATDPDPGRRYEDVEVLSRDLHALKRGQKTTRMTAAAGLAAAVTLAVTLGWDVSGPGEAAGLSQQAQALIDRRGIPNALKAAELFRRMIADDPASARGHAGLATAHAFMSLPYRGLAYETAYPVMQQAAMRALQLDPLLAEAHAAMGWVYAFERQWEKAETAFRRAIELNPGLTYAYTSYSISTLQPLKKYDEALRLLQVAAARDPLSLDVQREIGEIQLFSGRYAEALDTFQRLSEREPDFPFVHTYLARALTLTGRSTDAFPLLEPGVPYLALAYVATGRRAEAERLAAESESYPFRLAVVSAALGDTERAIRALERAAVVEPHRMGRLFIEPEIVALRGDPRVSALRRRFGLESAQRVPLADYQGVYAYHGDSTIALVAGDALLFAVLDEAKYPLRPLGEDRFLNGTGDTILFRRSTDGAVSGFVERTVFFARRTPKVDPDVVAAVLAPPRPRGPDGRAVRYAYEAPANLGDGLQVGEAGQAGVDPARIGALVNRVVEGTYPDIHSILVYRGGKLVVEEYFYGYDRERPHQMRSATKSIVSALVGLAIDRGAIAGDRALVTKHLPYEAYAHPDPRKAQLTLRDLLTMQSGLACDDWDGASPGNESRVYQSEDWVKYVLDLPMGEPPGTKGRYCSGNVLVAGRIVERATGKPLPEFAQRELFDPLGIRAASVRWNYTLAASNAGTFAQLYLRPRDMLKLGVLFQQNGRWGGRQVLSREWVAQSTKPLSTVGDQAYGYFWWHQWVNAATPEGPRRVDMVVATGNGGQKIYLIPSLDAVVVLTGGSYNAPRSPATEMMAKEILPALLSRTGPPAQIAVQRKRSHTVRLPFTSTGRSVEP